MQIQWYPGHMHKARKEIKQALPKVDVVIEILDARIPFSSENPMIAELRGDKPCIKILSKTDLADPVKTLQWIQFFEKQEGVEAVFTITTQKPETIQQIPRMIREKISFNDRPIHTMIVGIPNVGKSTLINQLAGRSIAKTGNEPAVTKGQQRIKLENGIILSDTPGVLWPNVENRNSGYRLAATGAVRDTAMEYADVAFFLADYLMRAYPEQLKERYELDHIPDTEIELLEMIGERRGCLRAGGQVELDKVSRIFVIEFRTGVLGQMSLELPDVMQKELAELEIIRAKKQAKKDAKEAQKKGRRRERKD